MKSSREIQGHLERADKSLQAAQTLYAEDLLDDAASRAYYAAFHAASGLLLTKGLQYGTHAGVLRAIGFTFVQSGLLAGKYGRDLCLEKVQFDINADLAFSSWLFVCR